MEDFSRPKIVYPETTLGAFFAFDDKEFLLDKTCFMIISDKARFLQQILSCKLFEVAYRKIFSSVELGEHGYQYNKHALVKLPVPNSISKIDDNINDIDIYKFYCLTKDEITYIENGGH